MKPGWTLAKHSIAIVAADLLIAGLLFCQETPGQKPTVLISGNGNVSVESNRSGGLTQTTVNKHDQTMEMAQDFLRDCPTSELTLDQSISPDYFVFLNRKGSPTMFGEIGQSQIMVLNRRKSPIFVAKLVTVKNAVKQACNAVAEDWQAHGRIPASGPPPAEPSSPASSVAIPQVSSTEPAGIVSVVAPGTVAVVLKPTAAAQKRCKPETISAILTDTTAYLTSKGLTLGTVTTSADTLVLIVDRPMSKWVEITVQERDRAGNALWSEKVSDGGWGHLGTTGLLNTLDKVHKIIDARMPEAKGTNRDQASKE